MPEDGERLLRDLLTANRAYQVAVLEEIFRRHILEASAELRPGLEEAVRIIRRYRAGEEE